MELNLRNIQQLDSHQILEILLPTINNLYKTFDYIGMTKEEFYNLVLREVDNSKRTYKGDIVYTEYIKNKINISLVDQIKNNLLEPKTAKIIIDNYIDKHLKKSDVYEVSIKNLKKLAKFFETYNYIPNPDLLLQIIEENKAFYKMIESIMEKHQTQIISGNLEKIFDDSTTILIIETYCMLNNIEIKEEEFSKDNIDLDNCELIDSVTAYLKEIRRRPLLSVEEEKKLAQRISQGDSYAKEIFIESNLKLVVSIAKRYIGLGLSLLDLIQEGNLGLMTAVDKYDVNRGLKFSTYATHWIRQAITRAIVDKGRNVRIPVHMYEKIVSYKKAIANLEVRLNRQPTINEIANELGLSISEVTKLHKLQNDTVSINKLIGDEDTELENFIVPLEETPEDLAILSTIQFQVRNLLENCNLKPQEIEVLMLRFGFNDREPMTLEEIGKKFNVTRERVRQIESKALMKIRKSKHIKALTEYMQNPVKSLENIEIFREKYRETGNSNKAFLKDDGRTRGRENKEMKKLQTIYQYFKDYTKEQVDLMLEKLTEEEKALIKLRYGEDLNNPISGKLSKEKTDKFYGSLVPKMRKLLSDSNKNIKPRKEEIKKLVNEQKQPIMESISEMSSDLIEETFVESQKNNTSDTEILNQKKEQQRNYINDDSIISKYYQTQDDIQDIEKEDFKKVLELLKTPIFNKMMSVLTVKESVIISLKLGYIDGKYFSIDSIAQFLGIEKQEVIDTTRKVLLLYKENINQFIDDAIDIVTEQPKQLTKKFQ